MQLTGNTILITGGTSGIGLAFAETLLQMGNKVIICGRREDRLFSIKEKHPEIATKLCDIADASEREDLYRWVLSNYAGVNVLVNNAGVQYATDLTKPVDLIKVKTEVETNLIAPIHLSSLFSEYLSQKQNGAIINISSGLAFTPLAFMAVYCATKAAVHSLTLSLRHQLRNTNVKVFEIAPPSVDTELGSDRREDKSQSHGGMPIQDFITEAIEALQNDVFEAPIAMARKLHQYNERVFQEMNGRFG
jgi:uncharacterized oxidoreductase